MKGFDRFMQKVQKQAQREYAVDQKVQTQETLQNLTERQSRQQAAEREYAEERWNSLYQFVTIGLFDDIMKQRGEAPVESDPLIQSLFTIFEKARQQTTKMFRFTPDPIPTDAENEQFHGILRLYWLHEGLSDEDKMLVLGMKMNLGIVRFMILEHLRDEMSEPQPCIVFTTLIQSVRRQVFPSRQVLEIADHLLDKVRMKLYDEFRRRREERIVQGLPLIPVQTSEETADMDEKIRKIMTTSVIIDAMQHEGLVPESADPMIQGL